MKILLISHYYPPLQGIGTQRISSWVKYLQRLGHETTVLTTKKGERSSGNNVIEVPYFDPIERLGEGRLKEKMATQKSVLGSFYRNRLNERLPGRCDLWIYPALKRLKSLPAQDLIISSYGPPSTHIIGYFAKKNSSALWFADFRDLWVDNHNYKGIWPLTLIEKWWEKKVCGRADVLITVSEGLSQRLKEKYPSKKVLVIPNGFDPEEYEKASSSFFKSRPKKFRLVYTGTIYEGKHKVEPLFEALKEISDEDSLFFEKFELLFFGSPSHYLNKKIKAFGLQNGVFYEGRVSPEVIRDVQMSSDAFLQLHFYFDRYDGLISGKIYEYLFANKPVVGVGIPPECELGRLIRSCEGGVLCSSVRDIKKTLLALAAGNFSRQSERNVIQRYSRRIQAEEIIAVAKEFAQRSMSASSQASIPKT